MSDVTPPTHCRIYQNGDARSIHIKRTLAAAIKECFPPKEDYLAIHDPEKETLTIFKPRAP